MNPWREGRDSPAISSIFGRDLPPHQVPGSELSDPHAILLDSPRPHLINQFNRLPHSQSPVSRLAQGLNNLDFRTNSISFAHQPGHQNAQIPQQHFTARMTGAAPAFHPQVFQQPLSFQPNHNHQQYPNQQSVSPIHNQFVPNHFVPPPQAQYVHPQQQFQTGPIPPTHAYQVPLQQPIPQTTNQTAPLQRPPSRMPNSYITDNRAPKICDNLRFFGDNKGLKQFLVEIHDELDQITLHDDKMKINWIARHFTSPTSTPSSMQIWFMGLLERNAFQQGVQSLYGNLKSLDYVLPELASLAIFLDELIYKFGDKNSDKTAREELDACKQGKLSIIDYNAKFEQLSLHVKKSEEDKILQYVEGLHPSIQLEATRIAGWVRETDLLCKQAMALEAADILYLRSKVAHNHPHLRTPGESYRHPQHHQNPINQQTNGPVPMDINVNAVSLERSGSNPFPVIRRICNDVMVWSHRVR